MQNKFIESIRLIIKQAIHFNNTRMLMLAFFKDIFQQNFTVQKNFLIKYVIVIWQCYSMTKTSYFITMYQFIF